VLSLRTIVIAAASVIVQACKQPDPKPSQATYVPPEAKTDSSPRQPAAKTQEPIPDKELVAANLRYSPNSFSEGDTLTLTMVTPHAEYLAVDHPDRTVCFIVYPTFGEPTRKYSMMPSEDFKTVASLRIPADIKANPRVYGRENGVERVFDKPGTYVLRIGELETDYGPPISKCVVRFRGVASPQ
jgi:hypothetical protein